MCSILDLMGNAHFESLYRFKYSPNYSNYIHITLHLEFRREIAMGTVQDSMQAGDIMQLLRQF